MTDSLPLVADEIHGRKNRKRWFPVCRPTPPTELEYSKMTGAFHYSLGLDPCFGIISLFRKFSK